MTTAPAPEPTAGPRTPRYRFAVAAWNRITAVLEASDEDELKVIHAALVLDADEYVAQTAEEIARPDDRWGPQ